MDQVMAGQGTARRWLASLDWTLLGAAAALSLFGLVMVYSATRSWVVGDPTYYLERQSVSLVIGLLGTVTAIALDYRRLLQLARVAYLAGVLLLVAVLLVGREVAGTRGWIALGPLSLQPAELAKPALVLMLAAYLGDHRPPERWRDFVPPVAMTALMGGLVLLQPDLGTAVVFGVILLGMLYVAQAPGRYLAWMAGAALAAVGLAVAVSALGWFEILRPHQLERLAVLVDPGSRRQGAGWNVTQSIIAIGSGRLFGQGLFAGPQTQLAFVPARHTDFIFAAVGEEFGFLGAAGVLGAHAVILRRCLAIAMQARDRSGALVAAGVAITLGFHVVVNVGMALGLMPVMGIPLPLLSYGGSNLVATLVAIGLAASVGARRHGW